MRKNVYRDKIVGLLKSPMTVTELRNKLEFKSIGTLSYHLKILLDKGLIGKKKQKNKQGQPTYYYRLEDLNKTPKNVEELLEWIGKTLHDSKIKLLRYIRKQGGETIIGDVEGDYDEDYFELLETLREEGLIEEYVKITKKGEDFLKRLN